MESGGWRRMRPPGTSRSGGRNAELDRCLRRTSDRRGPPPGSPARAKPAAQTRVAALRHSARPRPVERAAARVARRTGRPGPAARSPEVAPLPEQAGQGRAGQAAPRETRAQARHVARAARPATVPRTGALWPRARWAPPRSSGPPGQGPGARSWMPPRAARAPPPRTEGVPRPWKEQAGPAFRALRESVPEGSPRPPTRGSCRVWRIPSRHRARVVAPPAPGPDVPIRQSGHRPCRHAARTPGAARRAPAREGRHRHGARRRAAPS